MGNITNLEEYRNRQLNLREVDRMLLSSNTKDWFVKTIANLHLPNTTGNMRWDERKLGEEEMLGLPEVIRTRFPVQGNTLTVSRKNPVSSSISISNPDHSFTIEVQAQEEGSLLTVVTDGELTGFDSDTPQGRENTEKLAGNLLKLAVKPPFGPPPPAA